MKALSYIIDGMNRTRAPIAFTDDFNDNVNDPTKWSITNSADITVTETSGEKRFSADASYSGSVNVAYCSSVPVFNFTGKSVQVELPSIGAMLGNTIPIAGSGGSFFQIVDTGNSNNWAMMGFDSGTFYNWLSNNGTNSMQTSGAGNGDTKWKITHDSVNNKWQFLTWNGSSFTLRFTSAVATWNPTSVRVQMYCYIYGTNMQSVTSRFDNLISDATY